MNLLFNTVVVRGSAQHVRHDGHVEEEFCGGQIVLTTRKNNGSYFCSFKKKNQLRVFFFFCPMGVAELTGETTQLQPVYPGDRITSQCIRMMRAPALCLSQSYYHTQKGGQSLLC